MPITSKTGRKIELPTHDEEAEINTGILADPDTHELSAQEFKQLRPRGRPQSTQKSIRVSIRLAPDIAAYFKATGKGWQTRMNDALRSHINISK